MPNLQASGVHLAAAQALSGPFDPVGSTSTKNHMAPLDPASEGRRQTRPVVCFHYEGDVRVPQRFLQARQPCNGNRCQPRGTQDQIQIAPSMTSAVGAASVGPDFYIREVPRKQALDCRTMTR